MLGNRRVMFHGMFIMFFVTIFISGTIGFIRSIGYGGYVTDLFYNQLHIVSTILTLCFSIVCISAFAIIGSWLFPKVRDVWAVCLAIILTGILIIPSEALLMEMITWLADYLQPGLNNIKPFTAWYPLLDDYDFNKAFLYGTAIGLTYIALRVSKKSEHRIAKIVKWILIIGIFILPMKQLYEEYSIREITLIKIASSTAVG